MAAAGGTRERRISSNCWVLVLPDTICGGADWEFPPELGGAGRCRGSPSRGNVQQQEEKNGVLFKLFRHRSLTCSLLNLGYPRAGFRVFFFLIFFPSLDRFA